MSRSPSKLYYRDHWPSAENLSADSLLIFDQIFAARPLVWSWIKQFPNRYPVKSGEKLKDVSVFAKHIEAIEKKTRNLSSRNLKIIVLGGGSVGDFGGFVASVFKRGVELIHIPSTWLAAMDSAHGGKTALNVGGIKNQIGTFYPATKVYLIRPLLLGQPTERNFEALGEVIKMALLSGGKLYRALNRVSNFDGPALWTLLPMVVSEKYRIVQRDPKESKGSRQLLNLGHTMGHVFEAHFELPHGVAVLIGTQFAIEWSYQRGHLSQQDYLKLVRAPFWRVAVKEKLRSRWRHLTMASLLEERPSVYRNYLRQDKKKISMEKVRFIFIKKPGRPVIDTVHLKDIVAEIARQGLIWG